MSAMFAKFQSCTACVGAGYGWCTMRRKCGGFANKECGEGERYMIDDGKSQSAGQQGAGPASGGTDMRAVFAQYRTCTSCVGAGYGWCPMQRKCGGFANKECGAGERYVAEGAPAESGRSGLWESKASREASAEAEKPAEAAVEGASRPASGQILHAGPPSPPSEDADRDKGKAAAKTTEVATAATAKTFKKEVLAENGPVAVQFFAPWCGHCKALKPAWAQAAKALRGKVKLLVVDATAEPQLAEKYGVQGYPTIKLFGKNKRKPSSYEGARDADSLIRSLAQPFPEGDEKREKKAEAPAGNDMSATFAKLKSCTACVAAGYGWCPIKRKCGGFANKECGEGERYVAEGAGGPQKKQDAGPPADAAGGGTDMRAVFAQYRTCTSCVGAGYGWCPMQRKCGGFANKECGAGERYVAEGAPAESGRSGLWESKASREASAEAEKPAEAAVEGASRPASGQILHAGPPSPSEDAEGREKEEDKEPAIQRVAVDAAAAPKVVPLPRMLSRGELVGLERAQLVDKILELQHDLLLRASYD